MKGTALLIKDDHIVTVLENVGHDVYEEMASQENDKEIHCVIDEKEVEFGPVSKVVWLEDKIDWQYGY